MRFRTAPAVAAAVLGLAVTAPVAAVADSPSSSAPTVSQTASSFTVDLPGVGSLTFAVDPSTGSLSSLVATADSGFTAGTPRLTDEGVQVSFLDATGTSTVLQAEVEREDGTIKVKPEADDDAQEPAAAMNNPGANDQNESATDDDAGDAAEAQQPSAAMHRGDQNEAADDNDQADQAENPGSTGSGTPAPTTTTSTAGQSSASSSSDGDGDSHSGGSESHDGGSAQDGGGGSGGHDGGSVGTSGGGD